MIGSVTQEVHMGFDRNRAGAIVQDALVRLGARTGSTYAVPTIKWDLKGKSCLGQAVGGSVIRLHPEAADLLGEQYVETILHEVCHIAAEAERRKHAPTVRTGKWSAHGAVWRNMMRSLGQSPDRTCSLPEGVKLTPARKVKQFKVRCACKEHVVSQVRVNRGIERYHCRRCGTGLTVVGEVGA
jgi:predicted SprT family Zn-dependent metalloprotease